ncbi:hypothetical protein [Polaribacter sp. Hel1_85]|uniref:hypothetical protein n=1 Tax=Polaribacter sp. Hel1_85 TaxID=1250005 RepID=UPI00052BB9FC|nr:hypothetical protein [Polaribacter sp. Hel1_85]KGL58388.1 hypothetical protein PHEL85_3446 [Polaribacter sp. Hel1_85]
MKSRVFNNKIGSPNDFSYPKLTESENKQILASLFEQLLIFDSITITTSRINFPLAFLINQIGINSVERLIESGYIKFMIWSPVLMHGTGTQLDNGTIDESSIYGQPPIAAGSLTKNDLDPEKNIDIGLSHFNFHKDRKRIFKKKALKNYLIPNGMDFSTDSAKIVIDAYKANNLSELGLPFEKEPEQLNIEERKLMLHLSHKVLETAVLSQYNYKSYENYEHIKICEQNLKNIGKAYNVANNTSEILRLENLPNLKGLYLEENLDFNSIFKLRHLSNAKYYRKWINNVGENSNSQEVTKEYLNQLKGNNKFFDSSEGKFLKNLTMFGIGAALGNAISEPIAGGIASYTLGLLDTYVLDNILKGKNPSMFIEDIRMEKNNYR